MTVEVLLLAIVCGITLLAYMIAINAHGALRISFSYFLATMMLAGTVWLVVQYVNRDLEQKRNIEITRLEEKRKAEAEAFRKDAESMVEKNKVLSNYTAKLMILISNAAVVANQVLSVDLQNRDVNYETLVGRAADAKRRVDELVKQYSVMDSVQIYLPDQYVVVKEGLKSLSDAVQSYKSYYSSEDSAQEAMREKLLRVKAKDALEKFSKAGTMLNK